MNVCRLHVLFLIYTSTDVLERHIHRNLTQPAVRFVLSVSEGVNLLVGTENGLWLLDRSGQGKVYPLISRRRFQQMDVLEGLNVLITISGVWTVPHLVLYKVTVFVIGPEAFQCNSPASSFSVSVGKKNKLRLYYLSWLRNKILHNDPEVEKRQGWTSVGDLEGCMHYKVGKYALGVLIP